MGRVLSIDFGTSHTYISIGSTESTKATCAHLDDASGMETTILYCNKPTSPLVGRVATQEFGDSLPEERERGSYRFYSHFKPDILTSDNARRCTVDFLQAVLRNAEQQHIPLSPQTSLVLVGIPCDVPLAYKATLKQLTKEAGYGEVELVEEPLGALFDELSRKYLSFETIMEGLLVIDFGGGTCDFTFMRHGKIKRSWGSMDLGGRLFDDLFYQWFCELRPEMVARIAEDESEFFVRTYLCRELKEKFSNAMLLDKTALFKGKVGEYGQVRDLTWDEFLRRSRKYSPSKAFLQFQASAGETSSKILQNAPVDLIRWFETLLLEGVQAMGIQYDDIHAISLAGGSSRWCFVKDICLERLGIAATAISQSPNPYAAISEGLAAYPALRGEFASKQTRIKEGMQDFIRKEIEPEVIRCLDQCMDTIVTTVLSDLFFQKIRPFLTQFREQGGTILDLKNQISSYAASYQDSLFEVISETYEENIHLLYQTALEKTRDWIKREGLRLSYSDNLSYRLENNVGLVETRFDPEIAESVVFLIKWVVGSISTVIVASICGGSGMALIMSGPIGWIIGLAMGAAGMIALAAGVTKPATDYLESLRIPGTALYFVLTDAAIDSCRSKLQNELQDQLAVESKKIAEQIMSQMETAIRYELEKLNELNVAM